MYLIIADHREVGLHFSLGHVMSSLSLEGKVCIVQPRAGQP
jgi:hypothetical protein